MTTVQTPMPTVVRYALTLVRLYLGAWMLLNGLNHFVAIFPQPMGGADRSSQLMVTLIETGLFGLVKTTEIAVGVLLLLDLFVPLALVLAMPISVVVWYNHAILGGHPFAFSMGIGCLLWNLVLLASYLPYFLPMLSPRSELAVPPIDRLSELFNTAGQSGNPPLSKQRIATMAIGAALTAVLGYQLHPHVDQPVGAGRTPAQIVRQYMNISYAQGKPTEAAEMYVAADLADRKTLLALASEGSPVSDDIKKVVAQGSNVAVYHRVSSLAPRANVEMVDVFKVARSRIAEHSRVAQEPLSDTANR